MNFGAPELILILIIALLLFGAGRLPEIGRSLGKAIGEFKRATKEIQEDVQQAGSSEEASASSSPKKGKKSPQK